MVDTVNDSNPRLRHAYRWENRVNGGDFLMMLLKCVQITIHHAVLRAHLHGIKKLQTVLRYRKYKPKNCCSVQLCIADFRRQHQLAPHLRRQATLPHRGALTSEVPILTISKFVRVAVTPILNTYPNLVWSKWELQNLCNLWCRFEYFLGASRNWRTIRVVGITTFERYTSPAHMALETLIFAPFTIRGIAMVM